MRKREKSDKVHTSDENLRRDRRAAFHRRGFRNVPIYASTRAASAGMLLHRRIPLAVLKPPTLDPIEWLAKVAQANTACGIETTGLEPNQSKRYSCTGEYRLRY